MHLHLKELLQYQSLIKCLGDIFVWQEALSFSQVP